MDMIYWISEYGKILSAYLFLMFIWPSVVFRGHLKKKTVGYQFAFCTTVQIIIINTVVLILGLLHILNRWTVGLVFGGVFIVILLKKVMNYIDSEYRKTGLMEYPTVHASDGKHNSLIKLLTFGKMYLSYMKKATEYFIHEGRENYRQQVRKGLINVIQIFRHRGLHILEKYGPLAIVVVYGMVYFSYGVFQTHSYGHEDLYVHHEWIHGLEEGKIFTDGIYPMAMHCFIYCLSVLSGIRVYNIMLFLQGIHVAVLIISAYLLLRCVFHWRYTPIFVLVLFLVLDLGNADSIYSMSRLPMTLPMEFGLYTIFLCAMHLVKYLNEGYLVKKKLINYCWNENIILFMTALAAAAAIHFHVLIMAVILSAVFAVFSLKKLVKIKYLAPLAVAVLGACIIVSAPMVWAFTKNIPVSNSVLQEINFIDDLGSRGWNEISVSGRSVRDFVHEIYQKGYVALYGTKRAGLLLFLTLMMLGLCMFVGKEDNFGHIRQICRGYPPVILASVLYIFVYAISKPASWDMIPEDRFFAVGYMMVLAVAAMAADVVFSELKFGFGSTIVYVLSFVSIAGIYGGLAVSGRFHGYLLYELTRYDAAAKVTNSIINTYPKYSYTIVSPTDELYQVRSYGWHEELLSFVEKSNGGEYTLPSEYVFIFVEKKPILYGQSKAFNGPKWLAEEKYLELYWDAYSCRYPVNEANQSPEVIASQISEEAADRDMPEYDNPWTMYLQLENRTVLESKAYEWCGRFSERYPNTLRTYYEDEEYVCFCFQQDVNGTLYNLGKE